MLNKISAKNRGIIFIISEAFFFALMSTFIRLSGDLPVMQKSFFRNFVAVIVTAAVLIKKRENPIPSKKAITPLLVRSIAGTMGILCNFYAVDHLALADATMLNKLSPFFVIIFSFIILYEKVSFPQIVAVFIAFAGSLFIIKPGMNSAVFASTLGLCGSMTAGLAYTMVRLCNKRGAKGTQIVFFFSCFSCLFSLPYLIFAYHQMTLRQVMFLILAGCSATGGQFSLTEAYSSAPAKEISIYDYSQVIFASIIGFFLFNDIPDIWSVVGYIVICGASAVMFIYNNKSTE
ncbi:MAG: DMT family transporter [Clostridia bacterium]|jgi:drug/metabolite transporter (DMT)-like permease|nr:DMT family transporter [Clostridia bacterium]MCI1959045.1 DMT family transporter [Clostridia bacterium]MCI1998850.1 DMT family transporter [Clostridia bacterium]MCI2013600.1 DMT family transporter [Clostridia bacterium]